MKTSNTPLTGINFPICSIPSEKLNSLTPSGLSFGSTPDSGYPNKKLKISFYSSTTTMKNLIGQSTAVKAIMFLLFFTISFVSFGQSTAPSKPDLQTSFDTGTNNADDLTNLSSVSIDVDFVQSSTSTEIVLTVNGAVAGMVTVNSPTTTTTFTSVGLNVGANTITATSNEEGGSGTSPASTELVITVDNAAPATVAINDVTLDESGANVGVNLADAFNDIFDTDAQLTYNITDGGANSSTTSLAFGVFTASISANTLTLDPDAVGINTPAGEDLTIEATDRAGNTASQTFNVKVQQVDIVFSLSIDDGVGGNSETRSVSEIAANGSTEDFTFRVTADVAVNTTTIVNYSISEVITELAGTNDGNVDQTDDGNAALNGSGTITFEPGDTEKIVIYQVVGDNVVEGFEDIVMTLNSASNAGAGSLTVDALPSTLTIEDSDIAEIQFRQSPGGGLATTYTVDEAEGVLNFTLRLSRRIDRALKVNFGTFEIADGDASTGNDEAIQGTDYTALVNNQTWAAGTNGSGFDVQFAIPITDDQLVELDEEFNLTLVNILDATNGDIAFPTDGYNIRFDNAGGGDGAALCTINNDDTAVIKVNADQDITEGDSGTIDATFVASLSGTVDRNLSVSWIAQNGIGVDNQATSDDSQPTKPWLDDYVPDTGTVTFLANDASAQDTKTVAVKGDNIIEQDETFRFSLVAVPTIYATNANGNPISFEGGVVQLSSTATIENDDFGLLNVSTTADSNEANEVKTFTVALVGTDGNTKTVDVDINVDYEISSGTRTVNMMTTGDFFENDGSLTIAANNIQTTFLVDIYQDDVVEIDETFTATLTNLDVSDIAGANTRTAVTLDEETSINTLTKAYTYTILNEDFVKVQIFADAGATQDSKTVTETNADFITTLSVKIVEQASGLPTKTIDNDLLIDLGEFTSNTIQAASGTDYVLSDIVVIESGDMVQSFTVTVKGDEIVERDEDFTITIPTSSISVVDDGFASTPTVYSSYTGDNDVVIDLTRDETTVTIDNDDVTVLSITTINQISSAEANTLTFQVVSSLEVDADYDIEFTVEIPTRTDGSQIEMNDYTVQASQRAGGFATGTTLQFSELAGKNETLQIQILPTDDSLVELDEDFEIHLTDPDIAGTSAVVIDGREANLSASNVGTGTIFNDDAAEISVADLVSVDEGDVSGDNTQVTFTITMDNPADVTTNIPVTFTDETGSIVSLNDYTAPGSMTVTFNGTNDNTIVGPLTQTFTVSIDEDIQVEEDEILEITLGTPVGTGVAAREITIGAGDISAASVTIDNDDAALFSIVTSSPLSINEEGLGNDTNSMIKAPTTTVDFTIELRDTDNNMLTSVDEPVSLDVTFDLNEMTSTNFSGSGADFIPASAFAINGVTVPLGNITFDAGAGTYTMSVTFVPNSQTVDVSFTFNDDELVENNAGEDFTVALTALYADIDPSVDVVTPLDIDGTKDDITITVLETDFAIISMTQTLAGDMDGVYDEGADASSQVVTYQVTIDKDIDTDITIDWTITEDTALEDDGNPSTIGDGDFIADNSGTLTMVRTNDAVYTFSMTITGDDMLEADELLDIALVNSNATGLSRDVQFSNGNTPTAGTADDLAITTEIHNDDATELTVNATSNGDENAGAIQLTYELTNPIDIDMDVLIALGTQGMIPATLSSDYTYAMTVTFPAGETSYAVDVVTPMSDTIVERDETVDLTISDVTLADLNYRNDADGKIVTVGTAKNSVVTINNDDETIITITQPSTNNMDEGDGTNTMDFVVNSSLQVDADFLVTFSVNGTNGNSSTDGDGNTYDWDISFDNNETEAGSLTIYTVQFDALSTASQTITVTALDDNIVELDEYYEIELTVLDVDVFQDGRLSSFGANSATGVIDNDDDAFFEINDGITAIEGDESLDYTVEIRDSNGDPARIDLTGGATDLRVNYSIAGGMIDGINPAVDVNDVNSASITFNVDGDNISSQSATLLILTVDDLVGGLELVEADESVAVTLVSYDALGIDVDMSMSITTTPGDEIGDGTIYNDDDLEFRFTSVMGVTENETALSHGYSIDISNPVSNSVTIDVLFATSDNGMNDDLENDGSDYNLASAFNGGANNPATITFDALGSLQETYTFTWLADANTVEPDEQFTLTLQDFVAAWVGDTENASPVSINNSFDVVASTITENETATISVASDLSAMTDTIDEPDGSDTADVVFTISIDKNLENPIDINYVVSDYTTNSRAANEKLTPAPVGDDDYDLDYITPFGTVTSISSSTATTYTFTVTVNGDDVVEADEEFLSVIDFVGATAANKGYQNVVISGDAGDNNIVTTIANEDNAVIIIEADAVSVNEEDAATMKSVFVVKYDPAQGDVLVDRDMVINFTTYDGSGLNGVDEDAFSDNATAWRDDFESVNANYTILSGSNTTSSATEVVIKDDEVVELTQHFEVVIVEAMTSFSGRDVEIDVDQDSRTGTIADDDIAEISIDVDVASVLEPDSNTIDYGFTVTSSKEVERGVGYTVAYSLVDDTATDNDGPFGFQNDFDMDTSSPISFTGFFNANGNTQEDQAINVLINGDLDVELTETFDVQLGLINPNTGIWSGKIILDTGADVATGEITDADAATVTISNLTYSELEDSGSITFDITMSAAVDENINVGYAMFELTAESDIDFGFTLPESGDAIYTAGQSGLRQVTVDIVTDDIVEADEYFTFELRNIEDDLGAPTTRNVGFDLTEVGAEIIDDDKAYIHLEADHSVNEDAGTITFNVTLDGEVDRAFKVKFLTEDGSDLNGNATSPNEAFTGDNDYDARTGRLDFTGSRDEVKTITIVVTPDYKVEMDEFFFVTLDNNGITDTQTPLPKSITNASSELFGYNIEYRLGTPASPGAAAQASLRNTATIVNDDFAQITLFADAPDADFELIENSTLINYSIDIEAVSPSTTISGIDVPVTVNVQTGVRSATDGTNATSDVDFDAKTQSFTFSAPAIGANTGQTKKTFTVEINEDFVVEQDELFNVVVNGLSASNRAVILEDEDAGATPTSLTKATTITDDDQVYVKIEALDDSNGVITFDDEGNTTNSQTFRFTLVNKAGGSTTIDRDLKIDITDAMSGWATAGDDYTVPTDPIIINALSSTTEIEVDINGELVVERDEDFTLEITGLTVGDWNGSSFTQTYPSYVADGDVEISPSAGSATFTIMNDEEAVFSITPSNDSDVEGDGTNTLEYVVTSSHEVDAAYTVSFELDGLSDGFDPIEPADDVTYSYNGTGDLINFTGVFNNGSVESHTITVTFVDDPVVELDEEFAIDLLAVDASVFNGDGRDAKNSGSNNRAKGLIINDDEAYVTISDPVAVTEPNSGTTDLVFVVYIDAPVDANVNVMYTVGGEVTLAGNYPDYGTVDPLESTGVTFPLGIVTAGTETVTIPINGDNLVESDEIITVQLGTPSSGGRDVFINADETSLGESVIENNDEAQFTVTGATTTGEADGSVEYTITLDNPVDRSVEVDVDLTLTELNGNGEDDFNPSTAFNGGGINAYTLNFGAEVTSLSYTFNFKNSQMVEDDEDYIVTLENVNVNMGTNSIANSVRLNDTPADNTVTTTIEDDDRAYITLNANQSVDESVGTVTLTATLNGAVEEGVSVDWDLNDVTTTYNVDYTHAATGTFSFTAGTNSVGYVEAETITITIVDDKVVELDESFTIDLTDASVDAGGRNVHTGSAGTNANDADVSSTVTIENNDAVTVNITAAASAPEDASDTQDFTVTLLDGGDNTTTVDVAFDVTYVITDNTTENEDWDPNSGNTGSVTFTVGSLTQTFSIDILDDMIVELDETVDATITLGDVFSHSVTAGIVDATYTIDDDDSGTIVIDDILTSQDEDFGSYNHTISFLEPGVTTDINLGFVITRQDLNLFDVDDENTVNNPVLNAGNTNTLFTVTPEADIIVEQDENYEYELTSLDIATSIALGTRAITISSTEDVGSMTITNDDTTTLSIDADGSGDVFESNTITFTVTSSNPVDASFTASFTTSAGSTVIAAEASDYSANGGVLTLNFNGDDDEEQTITVLAIDDDIVEVDETFTLTLVDPQGTNAFVGGRLVAIDGSFGSADGTIEDTDFATITINDITPFNELDAGTQDLIYTVTKDKVIEGEDLTVNFTITGDVEAGDYNTSTPASSVTFSADGTVGANTTITIPIIGDEVVELDEEIIVTLTTHSLDDVYERVTIPVDGTEQGTSTILNDETATISVAQVSASSITEANGTISFEIVSSHDIDPDIDVTVNFTTNNGSAIIEEGATVGDNDYTALAGTQATIVSKTPGTYVKNVTIISDDIVETDEEFTFSISNLITTGDADVIFGTMTQTGTIFNDDQTQVRISSEGTIAETNGNITSTFTLTLDDQGSNNARSIDEDLYVYISGSDFNFGTGHLATQDVDYDIESNSIVTLTAGEMTKTFTITIIGDAVVERDEFFELTIDDIEVADPEITSYTVDTDVIINTVDNNDVAGLTITNDDETTFSLTNAAGPTTSENYPKRDESGTFTYTVTTSNAIESYNGETFGIGYTILNGGAAQIKYRDTEDVEDFATAMSGTITFGANPGVNAFVTQDVTLVDETLVELDEDFRFRIDEIDAELNENGRMAQFTSDDSFREFIGIIEDTDVAYVSVVVQGDSDKFETDLGEDDELVFDVTLSAPVDDLVSVTFSSLDGFIAEPGEDATTGDGDYTSNTGTATFDARTTSSQTITIPIIGDYKVEDDEKVGVLIENLKVDNVLVDVTSLWVEEVSIMTATTEGTILNDDAAVVVIRDAGDDGLGSNGFEGDTDTTPGKSVFKVYLYDATDLAGSVYTPVSVDRALTIQYITVDGTNSVDGNGLDLGAGSNIGAKNDFVSTNGTLTFPAEIDAPQTVNVNYVVDDTPENDEVFSAELQTVTLAITGGDTRAVTVGTGTNRIGTGYVLNDDRPKFRVDVPTSAPVGNGLENTRDVTFRVYLDGPIIGANTVTIDYVVSAGTATESVDYDGSASALSGTLEFSAGDTSQDITINVLDDAIGEGNEDLSIAISNPLASNKAELNDDPAKLEATATIIDDDVINVSVATSAAVVDESAGTVTFTLAIDKDITGGDVSFTYDILGALSSGNTATVTNDFTVGAVTDVITFADGSTAGATQTVVVSIVDDAVVEGDEYISMQLSNLTTTIPGVIVPTGLNFSNTEIETKITDNDAAVISIADFIINESTAEANVVVTTSSVIDRDVTVQLTTSEISATEAEDAGVDFATTNVSVVIPANMSTGSHTIVINNDDLVEGDEDFNIAIAAPAGAGTMNNANVTAGSSTAVVTIDDDDISTISIDATASVSEEVASGKVDVRVTLSKAVDVDMNITVNTLDVTTDGDDFTAQSNTVYPISAGSTFIDIPVLITNTNLVELSETFTVTISNLDVPSGIMDKNVSIGTAATSTVTITDQDQAIISIANISDTEENLGATPQTVMITMDNPVDSDVTFFLNTVEGTAKSTDDGSTPITESDFDLISGMTVTINANGGLAPNTTVYVTINDDNLVEADENFGLRLGTLNAGGRNVIFSSSAATVDATVSIDETDKSTISMSNVTQSEALGIMNFDIVISNPIDQPVNLTVNTRVVTATPGSDYTAISDATYTIPAGTLSASLLDLPVTITTDNLVEATESFTLELSGLTVAAGRDVSLTGLGATLNATGTILDNDEAQITFAATNTPTGTEGVGQLITFKIAMSNPVDQTVTFDYQTDFNANATAGFDAENKSNQLTFGAANNADKTVTVNLVNNDIVEGDEYFDLLLSNLAIPSGRNVYFYDGVAATATLNSTATISDDDVATISIANKAVTEDVDANAVLTLTSDKQIDKAIAIDVALTEVSANSGTDYDATGITNANLNALSLTTTLSVPILGGDIVEGTETFDVTISDESNSLTLDGYNIFIAAATDNVGVVTISDNDETTLSVADNSISEDGVSMIITVSTVKAFDSNVAVDIDFADVSTITDDFDHSSQTIQINEGAFSGTITVAINDDNIVDGTEEFTGTISALDVLTPIGTDDYQATIDDALGEYTIYDAGDHADFSITVDAPGNFDEGNNATFTVVNDGDQVDENVTVSFTYSGGTAEDGSDYTSVADVVITKLTSSASLTVATLETSGQPNGVLVEDTEDFMLSINSLDVDNLAAHSVSIGTTSAATATINDNDAAEITMSDMTVDEDAGTVTVKINTSNELDNDVTIDLTYVDSGLAVNGVDYTSGPASVTIMAGNLSADIVVTILDNDMIVEGDETFSINANTVTVANSGDNNVTITDAEGIVTIKDADATTVSVVSATVAEDDGMMTISVQTDNSYTFDKDVSVQVNLADLTTTSGVDYDATGVTTIPILAGNSSGAMTVTINTDNLVDGTEQFTATISDLSVGATAASSPDDTYDASINVATETMTITDIDQAMFSIADVTVSEGDGTAEVTLTNDTPIDEAVNVTFTFTDGTAKSGNDYTIVSVPVNVASGSMTNTLSIPILDMIGNFGQVVEGTEMFTVDIDQITVDPVDAADLADHMLSENDGTAEVTINDNDATTISLVSSVDNNTEEGEVMTFTIESVLEFDKDVTVLINTTDNTALAGSTNDYTALSGTTITIPAGTKEGVKTTATIENTIVEGTEDFSASISGLSVGAGDGYDAAINVAAATATYTINDDDATTISIVSATLSEDGGNMNIGIVSDSGLKFDKDVSVTVALTPGSATAADYGTLSSTTIVLPATSTTGFVTLPIVDDMIVDGDEAFTAKITNLSVGTGDGYDASISATNLAQYTIFDNDEAIITVSANKAVNEGDVSADNSVIEFTVTLDNMVDEELTLDYSTIAGTALASSDFINVTAGTLTFDALTANNSQTVTIQLVEDKTVEANESFNVEIGGLVVPDNTYEVSLQNGVEVVTSVTRVGTITNDDQAIISIADVTVKEIDKQAIISITMDNPVDKSVSITGNTRQTGSAIKGDDYVQVLGKAFTFDAGDTFTNTQIIVTINDDNLVEATESFLLELSDIVVDNRNVVFSSGGSTVSGEITITDADAAVISVSNETESENGNNMIFTVSLSAPVDKSVTISANTLNVTAVGGGNDFTSIVNSPITFSATDNESQTFIVPITNDDVVEGTEIFNLVLSNITVEAGRDVTFVGGGSSTTGVGTITDEDEASVSINDVTMIEGDAGTLTYTFDVTLTGGVDQNVTLDYTTGDGTATIDDNDYVAANGSLNFSGTAGQVLTLDVITNGDLVVEEDEIFNVILSNLDAGGKNVSINKATGVGTLTNTDSRPVVTEGIVINVSEDAEVTTMLSPVITATDLKGTPVWSIVSITAVSSAGNTVTTGLDAVFTIGSDDGIISVGEALDRETIAEYTVTVQVTDGINTSEVETVAVNVTDVNDNAPVVDALTFNVSDDASNVHVVGNITATDADLNPGFTSWLITSGNVDEVFALNSLTGELTVADNSNLDYDINPSYDLMITVSDGKFVSAPQLVQITIIDTNDAPTAITLTDSEDEDGDIDNVDIFESVDVGTIIGVFTTTDMDAGDEHTYTLVGGVGSDDNGLFSITNNELSTNTFIDFEETPIATIRVRTTDKQGESFEEVFTIVLIQDLTLELIFANTITPGGDGKNDKWIIENISAHPDATVTITNSDKSVIFSSVGYTVPFDGTFNGRPLPTGAYPFTIRLATGNAKGILHILRVETK